MFPVRSGQNSVNFSPGLEIFLSRLVPVVRTRFLLLNCDSRIHICSLRISSFFFMIHPWAVLTLLKNKKLIVNPLPARSD